MAADIEERLGLLPVTLEESYWDIYQEILDSGEHAARLAVFTFQWIMYAEDTVPAHEFADFASCTLSTGAASQTFNETDIIDVCANLVISRNGVLEFIHLSVREFLDGISRRSVDTMLREPNHGRIASASIRYLCTRGHKWYLERCGDDNRHAPSSMLKYTAAYWPIHVCRSGNLRMEDPLRTEIRTLLVQNSLKSISDYFEAWCDIWSRQEGSSWWTTHHFRYYSMKSLGDFPYDPIWVASFHGWLDVVDYLLEIDYPSLGQARFIGWCRNSSLGEHTPYKLVGEEMTPLLYAVVTGNYSLAECILNHQSASVARQTTTPDLRKRSTSRPLVRAAKLGDERLVTLLLAKDHGGHETEEAALFHATVAGHIEVCHILLDYQYCRQGR